IVSITTPVAAHHLVDIHVAASRARRCIAPSLLLKKLDRESFTDRCVPKRLKNRRFRPDHESIIACIAPSIKKNIRYDYAFIICDQPLIRGTVRPDFADREKSLSRLLA